MPAELGINRGEVIPSVQLQRLSHGSLWR